MKHNFTYEHEEIYGEGCTIYEECPHCSYEVELLAEFRLQECPECGRDMKPCRICGDLSKPYTLCATCPLGNDNPNPNNANSNNPEVVAPPLDYAELLEYRPPQPTTQPVADDAPDV